MDYLVIFIVFLHHDANCSGNTRLLQGSFPSRFFTDNPENGLFFQNPGV